MSSSQTLFLPSQVLTSEQASSRIQDLIKLYKSYEETPWTLPAEDHLQFNNAFAALTRYVVVVESLMIKLCMFFPDDVIQTSVAVIVCVHQQRELLVSCNQDGRATECIMTPATVRSMTNYLDILITELYHTILWVASKEGRRHRRMINEALTSMQASLSRFNCQNICGGVIPQTPDIQANTSSCRHRTAAGISPSSSSYEAHNDYPVSRPPRRDESRWDWPEITDEEDLEMLLKHFVPLSVPPEAFPSHRVRFGLGTESSRIRGRDNISSSPLERFLSASPSEPCPTLPVPTIVPCYPHAPHSPDNIIPAAYTAFHTPERDALGDELREQQDVDAVHRSRRVSSTTSKAQRRRSSYSPLHSNRAGRTSYGSTANNSPRHKNTSNLAAKVARQGCLCQLDRQRQFSVARAGSINSEARYSCGASSTAVSSGSSLGDDDDADMQLDDADVESHPYKSRPMLHRPSWFRRLIEYFTKYR